MSSPERLPRDKRWYRRLGSVPGVTYPTPPHIDRSRIRGTDIEPLRDSFPFLSWPIDGGSASGSPVSQNSSRIDTCETVGQLTALVEECLELPSDPSGYHQFLESTVEALWKMRRENPRALVALEHFALLCVQLILSPDDPATHHSPGGSYLLRHRSVDSLKKLYVLNGDVEAAWDIERRTRERLGTRDGALEQAYHALMAEREASGAD